MRTDVVGRWGAASHDGLRMTALLGGCARVSGRLKGAPGAVGYSGCSHFLPVSQQRRDLLGGAALSIDAQNGLGTRRSDQQP